MSASKLLLSEKYKAFLKCDAPVEFLEGTTAAGKTTVGIFKFMLKVAESPKKLHIIAADDTGTAEKNIINKDLGILDDFGIQPFDSQGRMNLMDIIEDRHGKKSTIITSQVPVKDWYDVIGEKTIADAVLDRIVHQAIRIELFGESLRKCKSKK